MDAFSFVAADFSVQAIFIGLCHLGLAYVLSLPIGWDREKVSRSAGIRTFPLVAVSSCAFVLMAGDLDPDTRSRVFQGIVTGLGFLGGGAILKNNDHVIGMSTAAAIWLTGAVGVATGLQRYELAIALTLICFLSLRYGKVVRGKNGDEEVADDDD